MLEVKVVDVPEYVLGSIRPSPNGPNLMLPGAHGRSPRGQTEL